MLWLAGETATQPPLSANSGFPWDLVGGIVIFVAMLVGAWLLIRLLSGKGFSRQGRYFRVLDRFPISRDCSILLLAVGSRVLAVCVGKDGGSLLCELDPVEIEGFSVGGAATKQESEGQDASFGKRFVHNMKYNMGVLPKGTPPMRPSAPQSAGKNDADFSAILQAIEKSGAAQETVQRSADPAEMRAADYRAAVDNMRRLAQTEAPAARSKPKPDPSAGTAPSPAGRTQSSDEETARELLRMLQDRKASHEKPKPADTKPSTPRTESSVGPRAGDAPVIRPDREDQIDEILDKIAQRQSRYASPKSKPGGHNRKDRS